MARPRHPKRAAARASGARYYLGADCLNQHGRGAEVQRYTSTGACRHCVAGRIVADTPAPVVATVVAEFESMFG